MTLNNPIAERPTKTVYRDGDVVIKLFVEGYSKADILNEALNHARAEETGLPVPKILEVTKIDGRWAIVIEYIEGKTLGELIAENPDKKQEYLEMFVNIQMEILSKSSPLMTELKYKMRKKISSCGLDATTRYELQTRLESMHTHTKVCHGDFVPSNVIITAEGKPYIIDWAHATQGNGAADAARTYLMFCLKGDEKTAKEYLELFCKKTDTAIQYVQSWLPIVAASQLVKGKEEEKEILNKWASVCDYQ